MLDEFILKQLEEIDAKLEKLTTKLKNLYREEESCSNMIKKLQDHEDVGLELFSPRNSDDTTRKKVAEIKKQIETIQLEQIHVGEEIEKERQEEEKYQKMLVEARSKTNSSTTTDHSGNNGVTVDAQSFQGEVQVEKEDSLTTKQDETERKEELKTILQRVDRCISLFGTDRGQCKHELNNLKYYLKALISKK